MHIYTHSIYVYMQYTVYVHGTFACILQLYMPVAVCWGSGLLTVGMCIIYAQVGKSLGGPSQWSNQGVLALFRDLIIHVNV